MRANRNIYIYIYMYIYVLCILSLRLCLTARLIAREPKCSSLSSSSLSHSLSLCLSLSRWLPSRESRERRREHRREHGNVWRFKHEKTLGKPMKNLSSYACHAATIRSRTTHHVSRISRENTGRVRYVTFPLRAIDRSPRGSRDPSSVDGIAREVTCAICVSRITRGSVD